MSESENPADFSFLDEMQDVKPLGEQDKVALARPQSTLAQQLKRASLEKEQQLSRNFLSIEHVDPIAPHDYLSYKKPGVQDGVFKNLRQGKYKIDSVLNLQKAKIEQARQAVFNTIQNAQDNGYRTILIKHGMGIDSKPFPAFTKSYVNRWLMQLPSVLAFHSAQSYHGGTAAVYVLIKKSESQKLANKELNRKR